MPHPILFVTQVPIPGDFTTIGSTFGNHLPAMARTGRGGDLWIRYGDGTLRNLTAEAGFGVEGFQDDAAIAVREPCVHWDGGKALFSMVIGAPEQQYQWEDYHWQIYEVTGLGREETPVITRVPNQPPGYNNVSPIYGSDDRILFCSDRPRDGAAHLHPQLDEYESAPTVTGIWSLDPASGDLRLIEHAPSGAFSLEIDTFGRLVFTRWDHLQRDQQADADEQGGSNGTFNWSSEAVDAIPLETREELFPEPRPTRTDLLEGTNLVGHTFNHFIPWMVDEHGGGEETLVHTGRHEILSYFSRSLNDDPNLVDFTGNQDDKVNNVLQLTQSGATPGHFFGIDAPEFYTHSCGQVVRLEAPPEHNADDFSISYLTHRSTSGFTDNPPPEHSGLYRNPLGLAHGAVVVAHTPETREDRNEGSREFPLSRYELRLKVLTRDGEYWVAGETLTPGIEKTISYYDPDVLVRYSGRLWELDPVEVRPRTRPAPVAPVLPQPELLVFQEEGVDPAELEAFLRAGDLALIVSRNVTARDAADRQQPFNLRVPGGVQTLGRDGKVYDVTSLQIFQADLIRGMGGTEDPRPGRRVLAQPMHDVDNPPHAEGPLGSVKVEADGSAAAFVPARRALSWQTTDGTGTPVVRERYWLTMQPGEIRTCTSCHGVNTQDQAGNPPPSNPPQALRKLLRFWKQQNPAGLEDVGLLASNNAGVPELRATPNPFRGPVEFRLDLPAPIRDGRIEIFDASGRKAATLPLAVELRAGQHVVAWSGASGGSLLSGSGGGESEGGGRGIGGARDMGGAREGTSGVASRSASGSGLSAGHYFARVVHAGGMGQAVRIVRLH